MTFKFNHFVKKRVRLFPIRTPIGCEFGTLIVGGLCVSVMFAVMVDRFRYWTNSLPDFLWGLTLSGSLSRTN